MTIYNIALIGFGGVNRALAELIATKNHLWERDLGFRLNIVAVSDLYLGSVISPNGLDAKTLVEANFAKGGFGQLSGGSSEADNETIIKTAPADIVVEATFTNPKDGEPAVSHCRWALQTGRHVVTTNKGPVAIAVRELKALAKANGVRFEYEGSVMSGTPVIRMAEKTLAGAEVKGFEGILNGTSNFVLGRMESGLDFAAAVKEAQELGYAEADPTADVEGFDVRLKVVILANELLGANLKPEDVTCKGISDLSPSEIEAAAKAHSRWKLIGSAVRAEDGKVTGSVAPKRLALEHRLASVSGATNAVSLNTELLGAVTITGPGAGRIETAYALLSDIVAIHAAATSGITKEAA
ncbi:MULTISPECIES: homoserine dehydrogenase [unclassified Mesorhizobium]|uniref:homoserine dehydrogenase n=1 Tax=unclassified Mesorhizobium TaxID=325217 RepID=UPI0024155E92|nr:MULTISPECIES: homoserine dehydrogenase [unclassified Mesorhizobium]MDG4889879.1 homoserine dehydrogenase [Mesorhizobium sp. WSM4887]MDG4904022.1 homoserine dehydrogenase [Mesorhizobium sp. WSM4962]MDG4909049.1 homoserine dehydrogenase [Mesorhizobium sp. WSM4898]MDG4921673.1 homoserine dehydrogenase [Mesorhizobium sp. WSM4989]